MQDTKKLSQRAQSKLIEITSENHLSLSLIASLSAHKETANERVAQTRLWSIRAMPYVKLKVAFIMTINSHTITITRVKPLIRFDFCLSIFFFSISGPFKGSF